MTTHVRICKHAEMGARFDNLDVRFSLRKRKQELTESLALAVVYRMCQKSGKELQNVFGHARVKRGRVGAGHVASAGQKLTR